jgi:hypothetical protein
MKKYILWLLVIACTPAFAQFKLSGKIKNYTGHAELKINIPLIYGFDDASSVKIPVDKNGSFSIVLPIKNQKFGDLIFQQNFHLILLSAGKSLRVELSESDKSFKPTAGTAMPENTVLQVANVEEYPFFLQNDAAYTGLSPEDLNEKLIKPYFAIRDKKITAVKQSFIGLKEKKLIISELKAAVYNNLFELTSLDQYKAKMDQLIVGVFDKADPKPEVFPAGPQYYFFADHYVWYKEIKADLAIKAQNLKPNQLMPGYGIAIAEANNLKTKYGFVYLRWIGATKFLPNPVIEQLGYQYINNAVNSGHSLLAKTIGQEYIKKFPSGIYKEEAQKKLAKLK